MSELVERVDEFDRLVGGAVEVGESTVDVGDLAPDPGEAARWGWLTEEELRRAVRRWEFDADGVVALERYPAAGRSG
ncbi:hypothetical protein ABZ918_07450 [Streptomyces viridosporus]|uniref:hypothetical protein n=1 Tax=Streptomyces viridosporus TaxID=67581 RepID=UPI0034465BA8